MSRLERLEVVGPFTGVTGYDRHTREFVREFVRAGLRVQLTPLADWSHPMPQALRESGFEALAAPVDADTTLHFTMPHQASARAGRLNVNFTMFEADRIPAEWVQRAREHQRIVVPSASSFEAWAASGVDERRLRLCPLGVAGAFFSQAAAPLPMHDRRGRSVMACRHRFLNVAELRPRKNHLGLLRAWMRATTRDDDAVLLLKTTASPQALATLRDDLAQVEARLGRTLEQAASLVVLADVLSDDAMRSLYCTAIHYVSMSHGEGWDLPMMEAGVAGAQLIAPRHSAYTTYLRDEDAHLLPARRIDAVFEGGAAGEDQVFFKGAHWWQPDEDAATQLIRDIIDGRVAERASPRERFIGDYSWDKAAHRLLELLEELR